MFFLFQVSSDPGYTSYSNESTKAHESRKPYRSFKFKKFSYHRRECFYELIFAVDSVYNKNLPRKAVFEINRAGRQLTLRYLRVLFSVWYQTNSLTMTAIFDFVFFDVVCATEDHTNDTRAALADTQLNIARIGYLCAIIIRNVAIRNKVI